MWQCVQIFNKNGKGISTALENSLSSKAMNIIMRKRQHEVETWQFDKKYQEQLDWKDYKCLHICELSMLY